MHLTHLPHPPLDFQGSLEVGFSTDTIIKETATFDSKLVLEHDISPSRNQQEKSNNPCEFCKILHFPPPNTFPPQNARGEQLEHIAVTFLNVFSEVTADNLIFMVSTVMRW